MEVSEMQHIKIILLILAVLITCAVVLLLFVGCNAVYFTWIYEPEISNEIDTETLATFTKVYKWWMQVENWEYQQQVKHINSLKQKGVLE